MEKKTASETPIQVMECALDMGETMLRCGAEILRVEDTITRICTAYGGGIVDVFTILSLIILSWKTDTGENHTLTRRINPHPTDLNKLEDLNALPDIFVRRNHHVVRFSRVSVRLWHRKNGASTNQK